MRTGRFIGAGGCEGGDGVEGLAVGHRLVQLADRLRIPCRAAAELRSCRVPAARRACRCAAQRDSQRVHESVVRLTEGPRGAAKRTPRRARLHHSGWADGIKVQAAGLRGRTILGRAEGIKVQAADERDRAVLEEAEGVRV